MISRILTIIPSEGEQGSVVIIYPDIILKSPLDKSPGTLCRVLGRQLLKLPIVAVPGDSHVIP